jgi:hypothetical protein
MKPLLSVGGRLLESHRVTPRTSRVFDDEVTFAAGVFDLFTYTIPGSLYLAFLGYLVTRLHLIDAGAVGRTPVLLLVIGVVVLSYLLGHMAYPLGHAANRMVPKRMRRRPQQGLLRCAESGQARSLIEVGQIAMTSSSRAARTRRFTVSSAPSS